jgi:hypothetical protein
MVMGSKLLYNAVTGAAMVLAGVAGTWALPRIASNPAVLYALGQLQMAKGNTSAGLHLITRATQAAPAEATANPKPSPAKSQAASRAAVQPRPRAVKSTRRFEFREQANAESIAVPGTAMFGPGFESVKFDGLPSSARIGHRARLVQLRTNRTEFREKLKREAELHARLGNFAGSIFLRIPSAAQPVQILARSAP